ncbi:MAG: arginine--tRNA ligase [Bacteroidetes bacterium]|nr:arginine--tRNA ligase [Bacteroidota bacterium]
MNLEPQLTFLTIQAIQSLYNSKVEAKSIVFQKTNAEFEGDLTVVVFPFLKMSKKSPEVTAKEIGVYLQANSSEVEHFNVVKGFLNLVISGKYWLDYFTEVAGNADYAFVPVTDSSPAVMLEYSSPNTNKPLHLGHIRNNLLGYSVAEILKANGNKVIKVNLVNDRGIHICKSMLAWKKWGNGETPESTGVKGDHLVGKYYVMFDKEFKVQSSKFKVEGMSEEDAEKKAPIMLEVQDMLRKWEAGDAEVVGLWKMMNSWVYKGFDETYNMLGVDFDKMYYESNTYLLGKKMIDEGLSKNVFKRDTDGSVFIDLTPDGLDKKILLRSDGTSVYMTQDIGTAVERFKEFPELSKLIYTVGNEQDYHFKVLFIVLKKLGYKWAESCYHLSYGMVELPEGKMKSREGKVVDADDLIKEMIDTARETTMELGKTAGQEQEEAEKLYYTIGLGALKYFILKVDPKKKMLFNPKESIDFNGHTGPFVQYTYARIQSVLRKGGEVKSWDGSTKLTTGLGVGKIDNKERNLIKIIYDFPGVVQDAGKEYNPGIIANYVYELSKEYNQFYHDITILKEENTDLRNFRLALSGKVAEVIRSSMNLLGIQVPEKM